MTAIPLQQHLHLALSVGGSPENAPIWKWISKDRLDIPEVIMSIERTMTGKLRTYVQKDEYGVVLHNHFKYTVKVQADYGFDLETRKAQLKSMDGKLAYLCDHYHAADGADHTATTLRVFVKSVGPFAPVGSALPFFEVDIELEDASRL